MSKLALTGDSRVRQRIGVTPAPSILPLATTILALSPTGYWKLNEGAGTTATDSSGNGRNGTYGGSGYTLQGAVGGDGANYVDLGNAASSQISIADNSVWTPSGPYSVFMLAKPDSVAGTTRQFLISKGAGSNFEYGYAINEGTAGLINVRVWTSSGAAIMACKSPNGTATTAWQGICFTHATPAQSGLVKIYVNNNTDISINETGNPGSVSDGTAAVQIGWRADSPASQYWAGGMAHVAIWSGTQLSGTNVNSIMAAAHAEGWF